MNENLNPFAPGAGTPPPALAGREELIKNVSVMLDRIKHGRAAKSKLFVGLRGVGKTVLLNHIREIAETTYGYKTIFIEAPENRRLPDLLAPKLRTLLLALDRSEFVVDKVKIALRTLKSFASAFKISFQGADIGLDPEIGYADSGDLEEDLPVLLVAIAEAAFARHAAVLVVMDEMQYLNENELSALIMAMHRIAQKQLPLVLIGAGLPQLVGLAGKSKSYAERLFDFPIVGELNKMDAKKALVEPVEREGVKLDNKAFEEIFRITEGYPYFLQEWGYQAWNTAPHSPISKEDVAITTPKVIEKLDESFFRVRFDRLTPKEKEYLRAMAELGPGPHRSGDIAAILNVRVQAVGAVRDSLIKKGMIYSPIHGDTAFTVPLFDQFMKRISPGLTQAE